MKDFRLAEAYCDRMYEAAAEQQGHQNGPWGGLASQPSYEMYLELIQVGTVLMKWL
jgi:hypothetical protein